MNEENPPSLALRVFLCHSSADKPFVRILYHLLRSEGVDPWLDEEDLIGGEEWEMKIRRVVRKSDIVIVCLSEKSINKAGFLHKEIRIALDVADEQPEGTIFLIPVKLEICDMPERLSRWHGVNLFQKNGYEHLLRALMVRANSLGISMKKSENICEVANLFNPENLEEYEFDSRLITIGKLFGLNTQGKFDESESLFEFFMVTNPKDYDFLLFYVFDLEEQHRQYETVIRILNDKLPDIQLDDPKWAGRLVKYRGLARLRRWFKDRANQEDLIMAERDLLLSVECNPELSESYANLSIIYTLKGELLKSFAYLDLAIKTSTEAEITITLNTLRNIGRRYPIYYLLRSRTFYE